MNQVNNLVTFLKQNNIKELLNLFDVQAKEFDAQVVGVESDKLILNIGSKTILAQNISSFSFTPGDKVRLANPVWKDGKLTFKIVDVISGKEESAAVSYFGRKHQEGALFKTLNTLKLENIFNFSEGSEGEIFVVPEDEFTAEFLEFAKKEKVFATSLEIGKDENVFLKLSDKTFELKKEVFFGSQNEKGILQKIELSEYKSENFIVIFEKGKGLIFVPQKNLMKDFLKGMLNDHIRNFDIKINNENDLFAFLGLIFSKKPLSKEEFIKEKSEFIRFVEKIKEFFERFQNKEAVKIQDVALNKKEEFLLFKIAGSHTEFSEQKVLQLLEKINPNQSQQITLDFDTFYMNIFNLKYELNNHQYEISVFVNKKKGVSNFKANSIMLKLTTQNIGTIGIYVKKVLHGSFKSIIVCERLSTLNLIKENQKQLLEFLEAKDYKLDIEYKIDQTTNSSLAVDYLIFDNTLSRFDLKV
uniref:Flagellar hook-length control protein FliK n=1 Tax=Caldicellulosiruptor owensensis TaxID=55205 RepID=A0A7C5Z2W3_9FIRM